MKQNCYRKLRYWMASTKWLAPFLYISRIVGILLCVVAAAAAASSKATQFRILMCSRMCKEYVECSFVCVCFSWSIFLSLDWPGGHITIPIPIHITITITMPNPWRSSAVLVCRLPSVKCTDDDGQRLQAGGTANRLEWGILLDGMGGFVDPGPRGQMANNSLPMKRGRWERSAFVWAHSRWAK